MLKSEHLLSINDFNSNKISSDLNVFDLVFCFYYVLCYCQCYYINSAHIYFMVFFNYFLLKLSEPEYSSSIFDY